MWNFRRKQRGEKIRNPIQGEFFATEAIEGPAQALVREAVQNSLDARLDGNAVRIRIALATGDDALPAKSAARFFEGAWPHYAARENGLRDAPTPVTDCAYLVIEDFGTKGLTGDTNQADGVPDKPNPFFLFFRAEGLSAKSGTELGRWGVGKFVFPRSSLASTHFGVTVRHDDRRRLLLGAVTLKAHRIADDGATYTPDGLYGRGDDDGFVSPIEDKGSIDHISAIFRLSRTIEPGLSVIVPFVDPEITFTALLSAALKDYFVPILHGRLEISIEVGRKGAVLQRDTIDQVLAEHSEIIAPGIGEFVQLAKWATGLSTADRLFLKSPGPDRSPKWQPELIPESELKAIREKIGRRDPVAIRVPVTVRHKTRAPVESYFDVYFRQDKSSNGRALFVREGIIVADVRGPRTSEVRSMVVIDERGLAGMLGDSENPAHTQWQKDSSNFRGKYVYGPGMIDFVTRSVSEILGIVTRGASDADPSLTIDFFSIEAPEDDSIDSMESDSRGPRRKPGSESASTPPDVAPRPTRLRIVRTAGGFSIQAGTAPPDVPYVIESRCAYDIRSGNALKKWNPADFDVGGDSTHVACVDGVVAVKASGNWLLLRVTDNSFRVTVSGFDEARDIYVKAEIRSNDDASTQN